MDDSRSVLPSGALVSRAALPSQSTQINFVCRCCGGSEFRVETRRGIVVDLATLREYQAVGMSERSGHYLLCTCTRCEASVQRAHDELRDVLIGKLLFAAKHLAETQFTRRVQYGRAELICVQCRMPQVDDNRLLHMDHCTVGRVAGILHGLMSLDDPIALRALMDGDGALLSLSAVASAESHPSDEDLSLGARQNGGVQ